MSSSQTDVQAAEMRQVLNAAVRRTVPPWLRDQADDLVQVAVLKILERKREEISELTRSYLYRTAHSVVVDEIRRRRRRKEDAMTPSRPEPREQHVVANPERMVRGREVGAEIEGCMERLREERRRAVTLHLLGHSIADTANLMGHPPKKAENLIYRGLADLRGCLGRKGLRPS